MRQENTFPAVLRRERKARGWGVRDLSRLCENSPSPGWFSKAENGEVDEPEMSTLYKLAAVFAAQPLRHGPQTVSEYLSYLITALGFPVSDVQQNDDELRGLNERLHRVVDGNELLQNVSELPPDVQRHVGTIVAALRVGATTPDLPPHTHQSQQTTSKGRSQTSRPAKKDDPRKQNGHQRG